MHKEGAAISHPDKEAQVKRRKGLSISHTAALCFCVCLSKLMLAPCDHWHRGFPWTLLSIPHLLPFDVCSELFICFLLSFL